MPKLISRTEALAAIRVFLKEEECLICAVNRGDHSILLERNALISVFLSAFPRSWGQVMINLNRHAESFSALSPEEWEAMQEAAFRYARILEKVLRPLRVYHSMMGSVSNLPNTCPHLHINLLPVYDEKLRPSELYTWEHGLYAGTAEEWEALKQALLAAQ